MSAAHKIGAAVVDLPSGAEGCGGTSPPATAVPPQPTFISTAEAERRALAYYEGVAAGLTIERIARNLGMVGTTYREWVNANLLGKPPQSRVSRPAPTFKTRDCYRCERPFKSTGAGHRHCDRCRIWLRDVDSGGAEPNPGGSRGRQVRAVRS